MPPINNSTVWRSSVYSQRSYLWLDKPPIVFQAQVNGNVTFPVADISYHNVSVGTYSDTWRFQTVIFGSAAGLDDLGRGYLRKNTTNTTIYVGRMSQGNSDGTCNISNGSYITVIDQFRVWARIPFIADGTTAVGGSTPVLGTSYRDWDLDSSIGINGSPQVNLGFGSGFANYGDPSNSDLLTMSFNAATYSKSYDSNISSYLWNVTDGTITSGSTTTAAITITFPVGRRYIHLTATDSNGNQTTRHLLIVNCKDGTDFEPIKNFDASKHDLDLSGNLSGFSVRIRQSIPRSTYPDQCNVIYWKEEFYNSVRGSQNVIGAFGQTGCESIKFSGWHWTDDNSTDAQNNGYINEVTLNCLDVTGWLNQLPGFSIEVDRTTAPTSWLQMKSSNMDKYFAEGILYYFSTARFLTDWYDTNTGDMYAFSRLGSGEATLYQQIRELADRAIGYEFTSNEQGMMFVRANQNLLLSGNRTNTSIITLTEDDITSIKYVHQRFPKQHWNRGAYVLVSTNDTQTGVTPQTSFWVAPGRAPGQGAESKDYNEQLALTSVEASIRTANRYAEDNTDFSDIEIVLREPGDAGIDPAYGQWITLNISSTYATQRGLNFTNTRLRVISVAWTEQSSSYGHTSTQKIIGRIETNGTSSQDDTPPTSNVTPPPQVAPPPVAIITNPYNVRHDGTSVIAHDKAHLALGNYFTSGGRWKPASMTGLSGDLLELALDPHSPFLVLKTGALGAYMMTTNGLYYINDVLITSSSWSFKQSLVISEEEMSLHPSTTTLGNVYVSGVDTPGNGWLFSNYGSNLVWNQQFGRPTPYHILPGCPADIDSYGSDEMIIGINKTTTTCALFRIVNGGAPVQITSDLSGQVYFIQKPLVKFNGSRNSAIDNTEDILFTIVDDSSGTHAYVYKYSGGVVTNITPPAPQGAYLKGIAKSLSFTTNTNVLAINGRGDGKIYSSTNGGVTWLTGGLAVATTNTTLGYYPTQVGSNYGLYGGGSNGMMYSPDLGQTIIDATGDWVTKIGSISGYFGSVIPLY